MQKRSFSRNLLFTLLSILAMLSLAFSSSVSSDKTNFYNAPEPSEMSAIHSEYVRFPIQTITPAASLVKHGVTFRKYNRLYSLYTGLADQISILPAMESLFYCNPLQLIDCSIPFFHYRC